MRTVLTHLAWGLATVALAVAIPVRAAALERPLTASNTAAVTMNAPTLAVISTPLTMTATTTSAATRTVSTASTRTGNIQPAPTPGLRTETGAGWTELYCLGCVAVGTYALYIGGIAMLPTILANPEAIGALTGACLTACRSVIESFT